MTRKRRQYGSGSIYPEGNRFRGAIQAGWTSSGTRRTIRVSGRTEAEVKAKLDAKVRQIAREGLPSAGGGERVTVKAWAEIWLAREAVKLRPKSYATTASAVQVWIIPTIGRKTLAGLTPGDVRAVTAAMRAAGLKSSSALRAHVTLTRLLRDAMVEGYPVPPRVLLVDRPQVNTNDRAAMTAAQAVAVLEIATELPHVSRWVAALLQGLRQSEALGLTWASVDRRPGFLDVSWQLQALPYLDRRDKARGFRVPDRFEARQLEGSLHLTRPKTARGQRVIPVIPWMSRALETWREIAPESPHDLVWPAFDGSPADPKDDLEEWKALQATAGVAHPAGRFFLGHEARHTAVTLLLEAGTDRAVIEAIVGHAKLVDAYVHAPEGMTQAALGRVAERLMLGD